MPYCDSSDCNAFFVKKSKNQRYCSTRCEKREDSRRRHARKPPKLKICTICNCSFIPKRGGQKKCGDCLSRLVNSKKSLRLIYCEYCGGPGIAKNRRAKYCSLTCTGRAWHEKKFARGRVENRTYTRRCTTCGRPTSNYRCDECWRAIREGQDEILGFDSEVMT